MHFAVIFADEGKDITGGAIKHCVISGENFFNIGVAHCDMVIGFFEEYGSLIFDGEGRKIGGGNGEFAISNDMIAFVIVLKNNIVVKSEKCFSLFRGRHFSVIG